MSTSGIFWQSASTISNIIWAILESLAIVIGGYFVVHKAVKTRKIAKDLAEERAETLEEEVRSLNAQDAMKDQLNAMDSKFDEQHRATLEILSNVNYAIFNAGRTGLKNRVDDLWEIVPKMQQDLATLVERTRNL